MKKLQRPRHCEKPMHRLYIRTGTKNRKWIKVGYYCTVCSKMTSEVNLMKDMGLKSFQPSVEILNEKVKNPKALIIDFGCLLTKVGFAGEKRPRYIFESAVCYLKSGETFIREADVFDTKKESVKTRWVIEEFSENVIKVDWDLMYLFLENVYLQMKIDPSKIPVIFISRLHYFSYIDGFKGKKKLVEDTLLPEEVKKELIAQQKPKKVPYFESKIKFNRKIAQIFFGKLNVPALFLCSEDLLSLNAFGKTSGLLVNIGASGIRIVPFYKNFMITRSVSMRSVGGKDVISALEQSLIKSGYKNAETVNEEDLRLRNIRLASEELCYVAEDINKEQEKWENSVRIERSFNLYNNQFATIRNIRFLAPEKLFYEDKLSLLDEKGDLADLIIETVLKCPKDIVETLFSNIVLAGGATMYRGFTRRLERDLKMKIGSKWNIRVEAHPDRLFSSWIGASILAESNYIDDHSLWTDRENYAEKGSYAVDNFI
ncbi:MAG: actin family protein [Candidatus Heimdallarchaeaceae archaeon]